MRLTPQSLSANGDSGWMIPNPLLHTPDVSLALTFSYDANLTAAVYYTYDDPAQIPIPVTLAWAANVLTITFPSAHKLIVADALTIEESVTGKFNGNFDVATVTSATVLTVALVGAGLPATDTAEACTFRLFEHPTLQGTGAPPARIDGNMPNQVAACRLKVTAYVAGSADLTGQHGKGG